MYTSILLRSSVCQCYCKSLYTGEWRHGLRSGEGEYIAADGTSYIGQWGYDKVVI